MARGARVASVPYPDSSAICVDFYDRVSAKVERRGAFRSSRSGQDGRVQSHSRHSGERTRSAPNGHVTVVEEAGALSVHVPSERIGGRGRDRKTPDRLSGLRDESLRG